MDPDKDIAEERLLRVIEKGQASSGSAAVGSAKGIHFFKWLRLWLAQNYSRPVARESDATLKILKTFSLFLWIGLGCFMVYFAADYISHRNSFFENHVGPRTSKNLSSGSAVLEENLKAESHYVEGLQNPNPFTGTQEELKVVEEVTRGPTPAEKLAEMAKGLVVVGINRGPVPDAIIENSNEKRTFFVKVGDPVNDMKVKEIKRDTVILTYEGEDVEIV